MALTAKKSYAKGMGPFPSDIYRAEFPYLYHAPKGYSEQEAIAYYLDKLNTLFDEAAPASDIAAMIVEPVQGEGGFVPAPIEWVKAVRKICDDNGILLLLMKYSVETVEVADTMPQNIGRKQVLHQIL